MSKNIMNIISHMQTYYQKVFGILIPLNCLAQSWRQKQTGLLALEHNCKVPVKVFDMVQGQNSIEKQEISDFLLKQKTYIINVSVASGNEIFVEVIIE